jgi:hypothetical protein
MFLDRNNSVKPLISGPAATGAIEQVRVTRESRKHKRSLVIGAGLSQDFLRPRRLVLAANGYLGDRMLSFVDNRPPNLNDTTLVLGSTARGHLEKQHRSCEDKEGYGVMYDRKHMDVALILRLFTPPNRGSNASIM